MDKRPKEFLENSERLEKISNALDAMKYLNNMMRDDSEDEISMLLESALIIMTVTYNNMLRVKTLKPSSGENSDNLLNFTVK